MLQRIADGRTDLVFRWIADGGDPRAESGGSSLLGWCAYYGDVSAIRFLQGHGVPLAALGPDLGLNGAAFHGHWRLCEYLLEHGADPCSRLRDTGETPLHAALCKLESLAHERVIEVLVAAGSAPRRSPGSKPGPSCAMCAPAARRRCIARPPMAPPARSGC